MLSSRPSLFLRQALLVDAVITGATGLLMFFGAGFLAGLLRLPEPLLRYAGLALFPFVVFVAYVATRERVQGSEVWAIIIANVLWTVASVVLLLGNWVAPNALGFAFIIFQAVVVAAFAATQYLGVRRSSQTAT